MIDKQTAAKNEAGVYLLSGKYKDHDINPYQRLTFVIEKLSHCNSYQDDIALLSHNFIMV